MNSELDPVEAEEVILGRIHRDHYNPSLPIPFLPVAFRPTVDDEDSLSVYRERFVASVAVATAGRTPGAYYVVRLAMSALRHLNLTVVPVPADLPGHAVIPELNRKRYETDKATLKRIQLELAKLAAQAIVLQPDG
jgi:hypothetical protein